MNILSTERDFYVKFLNYDSKKTSSEFINF